MKPLIQSFLQIIDRRGERGDLGYWSPEAIARLRAVVGYSDAPERLMHEAALALSDFRPRPAATFSESSASLQGLVTIVGAFLEQAKGLPSNLYLPVRDVAQRLCDIGEQVEKIELLLGTRRIKICAA